MIQNYVKHVVSEPIFCTTEDASVVQSAFFEVQQMGD